MLSRAVRPYSVFSLHNVCKSIRRKPEQCDDVGQEPGPSHPGGGSAVSQETHLDLSFTTGHVRKPLYLVPQRLRLEDCISKTILPWGLTDGCVWTSWGVLHGQYCAVKDEETET
ncbi:uncharacterized protein LOC112629752 [Theropithecus gelada]|uniref:uncharacterized protein LOC112629752 n=1 Tax=Theropithecus gelada TaxID=9565 RepID=UPI000DC16FFA|nr:uncharacterized protein LOC112629752 [Theropithecus gelada]